MFNSPIKPHRGALPGNTNAVKHGFYAKQFKNSDIKALEKSDPLNLADEIDMIRVFILRVVELSSIELSLPEALETLRVLSFAATCLTRLVNTQRLAGTGSQTMDEFKAFLDEVIEELQKEEPPPAPQSRPPLSLP